MSKRKKREKEFDKEEKCKDEQSSYTSIKGKIIVPISIIIFTIIFYTVINILINNDFVLVALGVLTTLLTDTLMRNMSFISRSTRKVQTVYKLNFRGEETLSFIKLLISVITISTLVSRNVTIIIFPFVLKFSIFGSYFTKIITQSLIFVTCFVVLIVITMSFVEYVYSIKKELYTLHEKNVPRSIKYKRKRKK